jgi:MFS family permease
VSFALDIEDSRYQLGSIKAWVVCFSAALFFFYEFIQMHMFNAINDDLRMAFNSNATELSFLSSTYLWADLLFLLPAGIVLDRFSVRKVIIAAMVICIVGTLGFALSHQFALAAFFHFVSGIGNAFCFLSCIILVSRWFPANRQALVIGLVVTMAFIGGMVAQTPLAWFTEHYGWRQALFLDTFLGLAILALIVLKVENTPSSLTRISAAKQIPFWTGMQQVIKNRQNWLPGFYTCFLNLPIMVLCALWGITYLEKVHHLSTIQASQVTSMIFIGSIVGAPLAGFVSDTIRQRRLPMLWGGVLTLICISLVMFNIHASYILLLSLFFAMGLFSSTQVIAYPMIAESNPHQLTGTATGLASLIIMGGAGVAQVLFGKLLDWQWDGGIDMGQRVYSAMNYHFAMMMFPIAFILGLIAIYFASETFSRNQ